MLFLLVNEMKASTKSEGLVVLASSRVVGNVGEVTNPFSGPSDTRAPARFRWEVIHAGVQDLINNFNVGGDPRT